MRSPQEEGAGQRSYLLLTVLGFLSLIGYAWAGLILDFYSSQGDVFRFLALWTLLFALFSLSYFCARSLSTLPSGRVVAIIFVFAAAFRLLMLFAGLPSGDKWHGTLADLRGEVRFERFLVYDHDIWRYLWDGHVLASGQDPYANTPNQWMARYEQADPLAEALFAEDRWEDIYDYLDYRDYTTVYPPLAQAFFRLCHHVAPGSVWMLKLGVILLDLAVCWLLLLSLRHLKRPPFEVLLYAWNPLVIKEYAGSGHLDPLMIFWLVLAVYACLRERHGLTMTSLGLAVLAKLSPLILVPFFLRRTPWKFWPLAALPLLLGYGYFWRSLGSLWQGLSTFANEWVFNPGPWALLNGMITSLGMPTKVTHVFAGLLLVLAVGLAWLWDRRDENSLTRICFGLLACLLLLSPAVMPWYLPWALAMAVLVGDRSWLFLTFLALGSYLIYIDQQVRPWWLFVEYGLFFALWGWFTYRSHKRGLREHHPILTGEKAVAPKRVL